MEKYIDGYLLAVPRAKLPTYKNMAEQAMAVWMEHGALDYRECVAEDIDREGFGSFTAAAGAKEDETVVFAWVVFENKAERDRINALVMADPRLTACLAKAFSISSACAWAASIPWSANKTRAACRNRQPPFVVEKGGARPHWTRVLRPPLIVHDSGDTPWLRPQRIPSPTACTR